MAGKQQPREITIACETCKAYGILSQTDGQMAIVCVACGGKGSRVLTFEPFAGRKKRDGISRVRRAGQGLSPFGRGRKRVGIPYGEFLKGKLP